MSRAGVGFTGVANKQIRDALDDYDDSESQSRKQSSARSLQSNSHRSMNQDTDDPFAQDNDEPSVNNNNHNHNNDAADEYEGNLQIHNNADNISTSVATNNNP